MALGSCFQHGPVGLLRMQQTHTSPKTFLEHTLKQNPHKKYCNTQKHETSLPNPQAASSNEAAGWFLPKCKKTQSLVHN